MAVTFFAIYLTAIQRVWATWLHCFTFSTVSLAQSLKPKPSLSYTSGLFHLCFILICMWFGDVDLRILFMIILAFSSVFFPNHVFWIWVEFSLLFQSFYLFSLLWVLHFYIEQPPCPKWIILWDLYFLIQTHFFLFTYIIGLINRMHLGAWHVHLKPYGCNYLVIFLGKGFVACSIQYLGTYFRKCMMC